MSKLVGIDNRRLVYDSGSRQEVPGWLACEWIPEVGAKLTFVGGDGHTRGLIFGPGTEPETVRECIGVLRGAYSRAQLPKGV